MFASCFSFGRIVSSFTTIKTTVTRTAWHCVHEIRGLQHRGLEKPLSFYGMDTDRATGIMRPTKGRGLSQINLPVDKCLCDRPHCFVLCNACGYWTKGRVRYFCPIHPQTIFLFDISQCPRCKSYEYMLTEFGRDV